LLRAVVDGYQRGVVQPSWGRVACAAQLTSGYRLEIVVAKRLGKCGSVARTPFMSFRDAQFWVAVWGRSATIQLWTAAGGFRNVAGDLAGGTCARPTTSRVFHVWSVGPDTEALRLSRWHLRIPAPLGGERDGDEGLCIFHPGRRDFVADDRPIPDRSLRRIQTRQRLEIDFGFPNDFFRAVVRPGKAGRVTLISVHGPAVGGSSEWIGHVRPGTCKRISGPEQPLVLTPDAAADRASGFLEVGVPYRQFVRRSNVVELHTTWAGAEVATCARLTPSD